MKDLDPHYVPDWAKLKEQYDATDPEANAGVSSEINEWHRKNQANYKKLVELLRWYGDSDADLRGSRPCLWSCPSGVAGEHGSDRSWFLCDPEQ